MTASPAPLRFLHMGIVAGAATPLLIAVTKGSGLSQIQRLLLVMAISGALFFVGLVKAALYSPRAYTGYVGAYFLGMSGAMVVAGLAWRVGHPHLALAMLPGLILGLSLMRSSRRR